MMFQLNDSPSIMSVDRNNNLSEINKLIEDHLITKCINLKNRKWEIGDSPLGGRGLFAARDIKAGEIIFVDLPMILGPRAAAINNLCHTFCTVCYKSTTLRRCGRNCGLLICGDDCESSGVHQMDCQKLCEWKRRDFNEDEAEVLTKCLTPVRVFALTIEERYLIYTLKAHNHPKHGFEIDTLTGALSCVIPAEEESLLRTVCQVMDANAFEVIVAGNDQYTGSLRGLYPLGALANHSCAPNTMHIFDSNKCMVTKATLDIAQGSEIFHSYNRLIWATATRRFQLVTSKHFACRCPRCSDPSEFGSFMGAIWCQECRQKKIKSYVIPTKPLSHKTTWICLTCRVVRSPNQVTFISSVLGGRIKTLTTVDEIIKFIEEVLVDYVPIDCNQIAMELKYQLVWALGYQERYKWNELTDCLLLYKEKICDEILQLLNKLQSGESKMKGLMLYELVCCNREKSRRVEAKICTRVLTCNEDIENNLKTSSQILMYDVGAPDEIKKLWKQESVDIKDIENL